MKGGEGMDKEKGLFEEMEQREAVFWMLENLSVEALVLLGVL